MNHYEDTQELIESIKKGVDEMATIWTMISVLVPTIGALALFLILS